ncbi:MAG: class I SAM-dependent methyltransferase [Thaumarchaeota archaeon]|nr:class I SAM-dependent methyltransferase [Nitrososphaerota archaeon]
MYYKGEKMGETSSNTDLHGFGPQIRSELAARIPFDRKLRVLDVGTGFGLNVGFLTGHLSRSSKIWTVDPSSEVLDKVKSDLGRKAASTVEFVKASADRLDFENGFFDFAVSVMVMHHIDSIEPVLEELVRVVKGGGGLFIVDFYPKAARTLEFQTRHKERDFFEPATIKKQLTKAATDVKTVDFGLWYLVEATKPSRREMSPKSASRRPGPS